jgi:hypothetical protein
VAEGRLGLEVPISGYVIAEDRSPGARIAAASRLARYQALRMRVRARRLARQSQIMAALLIQSWHGLTSRITATRAILGHVADRDEAEVVASSVLRRPRAGLVVVGLIVVAFAAALFVPDRLETVPPAEAATPAEPPTPTVVPESEPPPPAQSVTPASLSPMPAQWQPLRKPMAIYHLESPDLAGLELNYRVSMRGTSRQDSLIWQLRAENTNEARRTLAQFVIERHEGAPITERPLFADLAARAADQHLSLERMARPQDIRTKFGTFEAAEATIRQEDRAHACIGFRRIDMAGLTLVGWVCGTAQKPVDRVSLVCFIDRLDLVGGRRDAGLRKVFAEAERARVACASARQSGKRLTWLDHEAPVPSLKLSARTR